jgi:23S rRNA pseudouridine1911/1915/1917 synthase
MFPVDEIAGYSTVGEMEDQVARHYKQAWEVPAELENIRLDLFLRRCLPQLSRRKIDEALHANLFVIDGKVARKGDRLNGGNAVVFTGPAEWLAPHPLADFRLEVPIIYEDSTILVLNKPAGLATHGFSGKDTRTLANFLLARRPNLVEIGKSRWEPGLVQRLDTETSGLLIVAKTQAAFDRFRLQLRRRQIKKTYLTLVWGKTAAEGIIDLPLVHDRSDKRRMQPAAAKAPAKKQKIWPAVTRFRKCADGAGVSFLEVQMTTGVMHQIRVHLAAIDHPIVGDSVYGPHSAENFGLKRHFLHASGLEFRHPDNGGIIKLRAELPSELQELLRHLQMKL